MTTNDLVSAMWEKFPHLKKRDVEAFLKGYADFIAGEVLEGTEVILPGVGNFYLSVSATDQKKYDPRTKTMVSYPGGVKRIKFRMFQSVGK